MRKVSEPLNKVFPVKASLENFETTFFYPGSAWEEIDGIFSKNQYERLDLGYRDFELDRILSTYDGEKVVEKDFLQGATFSYISDIANKEQLLKSLGNKAVPFDGNDIVVTDDGSYLNNLKSMTLFERKIEELEARGYIFEVYKNKKVERDEGWVAPESYKGDIIVIRGKDFYGPGVIQGYEFKTEYAGENLENEFANFGDRLDNTEESSYGWMSEIISDGSGMFKTTIKRSNAFSEIDTKWNGKFSKNTKEKIDDLYEENRDNWSNGGSQAAIASIVSNNYLKGLLHSVVIGFMTNLPQKLQDQVVIDATTEMINHIRNFNQEFSAFNHRNSDMESSLDYKNIILRRFFNKTLKNKNRYKKILQFTKVKYKVRLII